MNFVVILMHIFEKLSQILGLSPIVKFRSDPRKIGPQTFGGPPQRKILHELLFINRSITSSYMDSIWVHTKSASVFLRELSK